MSEPRSTPTEISPTAAAWYAYVDKLFPSAAAVLEGVQVRANTASPGPWSVEHDTCGCSADGYCGQGCKEPYPYAIVGPANAAQLEGYEYSISEVAEMSEEDVAFITHARSDIPALLSYIAAGRVHTLAFIRTLHDGTVYECVCNCGQELPIDEDGEEGPVFEKHRVQEQESALRTCIGHQERD